ncbi:MAG: hypothetical protein JWQ96_2771 [Segetibacter sp.]|nr:hypothetical protein [Segetibacter sp.]
MKKSLLILSFCFISFASIAQKKVHKYNISSINQLGLLTGERGEAVQIQTINGVAKGNWFAGIGVGIDAYADRTVPLFLHTQHQFLKGSHSPVMYAAGGFSLPYLNFIQKEQLGIPNLETTPMYDIGVGWKFFMRGNRGLLLTAGYSYKQIKGSRELWKITIWPAGATTWETIEKNYTRISIKVGWQF